MSFHRYPTYKDSGVSWLGDVPNHWDVQPLYGSVVERLESNKGMIENNLLSLSYGRIVSKDISSNDGLLPESFETYQVVKPGDIVFRLTDLQNDKRSLRSAIVEETGIITSAYLAVIPHGPHSKYLNYLFRAYDVTKVFYSMGGGLRQSMKFADLKRMPTLLPPLAEQTAIAAFLDLETEKIDALVAEQQRLIELLKEKRRAVISHAVTKGLNPDAVMKRSGVEWLGDLPAHWDVKPMRMIANVVRGASPRPAGDPRYFGGDVMPWVTVAEITKDDAVYLTETESFLTQEGSTHSNLFRSGTLIYSNSGATLGVPKILLIDACANDGVVAFVNLNGQVQTEFLYHYLASITDSIREKVRQGSGQPNLNTDIVKDLRFGLPSLDEQKLIVSRISELANQFGALTVEAQRAIDLLQERRTALISGAVTGQIDVRGLVESGPG